MKKCKHNTDYLLHFQTGAATYIFDGNNYEFKDFEAFDFDENSYCCPNCFKKISSFEEGAKAFLEKKKNKRR